MPRNFCATQWLNEFEVKDYKENIQKLFEICDKKGKDIIKYICVQLEQGGNKSKLKDRMKHLQIYFETGQERGIDYMKKKFNKFFKIKVFMQKAKNRNGARNYCTNLKPKEKKETILEDYFELGNWTGGGQGRRSDIAAEKKKILDNPKVSILERCVNDDATFSVAAKNLNFLQKFRMVVLKKEFRDIKINIFIGPSGVGKSHNVWSKGMDNLYNVPKKNKRGTLWFDNYNGEERILIDEFKGWISLLELLVLLDKYPLQLQVKGGYVNAEFTEVNICSNYDIEEWYPNSFGNKSYLALLRRIKQNGTVWKYDDKKKKFAICEVGGNKKPPLRLLERDDEKILSVEDMKTIDVL